ncbi:hypothetical protein SEA_PHABIA_7 [Microbacterium phage Phabia]|nr:hypothetical protein SEA_PHABIA_7 [Microbacterium phage Phabia]QWY80392.1 hypothetical protein SEA_TEEHEE_9 [Microbacterium phage Teehee]QXN73402.1 hypothetical protein SEA_JEHOSHAPHAT_9 [Microbacterium phage Jehoshaphat]
MTAWVRRTDPKPGSRNWRHIAICTPCEWHGYRFDSVDSAEKQATKHNTEKHQEES